jgi:3-hydroxybutyryl-CoA dehydrogenase
MLKAAVIGAGLMGRGIALVAARSGAQVSLFDSNADVLREAISMLSAEKASVRACGTLEEAIAGVELVTEAIIEDLDIKQELFQRMGAICPDAILATNTSVIPVTKIAAKTARPERVVGTHWWNPPDLIPVVEVVRGERTSAKTVDRALAVVAGFGKTPVRVDKDVPGFVGNRLQHALWREAIALVADGVCDAETVDLMARNTIGLRLGAMGPIENADYVGLDLTLAIHDNVLPSLNRDPHASPRLRGMVAAGQLGAKSGDGFLHWPAGARARAAARLARHVANQLADPSREPGQNNQER